MAWKKNGPYNLKCRAVLHLQPSGHDSGGGTPNGEAGPAAGSIDRRGSDDSMATMEDVSPQSLAAAGSGGGPLAMAAAADDAREARAAAAAAAGADGADGGGGGGGEPLEKEVKFEAQLYKMRDGEYALDFQVSTAGKPGAAGTALGAAAGSLGRRGVAGGEVVGYIELPYVRWEVLCCPPHACPLPTQLNFSACCPSRPRPLQRLSGDLFLFMDTCSSLLSVLRL